MTSFINQSARAQRFHIYVDESSQNAHRFMVLGALVINTEGIDALDAKFQQVRERYRMDHELKWGKASTSKLDAYEAYLKVALGCLSRRTPCFHSIVIDTSELDHKRFNGGDSETGFSKFVYQLLTKCASLSPHDSALDGFLDERTTRQTPNELRRILNNGMGKKLSRRPFKRLEFRNSKLCNFIQAVDLLTGAVAFHWNGHHRKEGASPVRIWLAQMVATEIGLPHLAMSTARSDPFSIWKWRGGKSPGRA